MTQGCCERSVCVWWLSTNAEIKIKIASAGGIRPLFVRLASPSDLRKAAAGAMYSLDMSNDVLHSRACWLSHPLSLPLPHCAPKPCAAWFLARTAQHTTLYQQAGPRTRIYTYISHGTRNIATARHCVVGCLNPSKPVVVGNRRGSGRASAAATTSTTPSTSAPINAATTSIALRSRCRGIHGARRCCRQQRFHSLRILPTRRYHYCAAP